MIVKIYYNNLKQRQMEVTKLSYSRQTNPLPTLSGKREEGSANLGQKVWREQIAKMPQDVRQHPRFEARSGPPTAPAPYQEKNLAIYKQT